MRGNDTTKTWVHDTTDETLFALRQRYSQVLDLHFGLRTGVRCSLKEIGLRLGVTKERVRQIEKRAMSELYGQEGALEQSQVFRHTREALKTFGGVARFAQLVQQLGDSLPCNVVSTVGFTRLALKADPEVVKLWINHIEVWALCDVPYDVIPKIRGLCKSILKDAIMGLEYNNVVNRILKQVADRRVSESFVAGVIDVCPRTMVVDDKWLFDVNHPNVPRHRMIVAILREAGQPLHFDRITEELNNRMEKQSTARAVHGSLLRYPNIFVRIELGIYGLLE